MNELYQTQILALARTVRQGVCISEPTHTATIKNPLCGDEVTLRVQCDENVIRHVSAEVRGCALCEAGAGLYLQLASGNTFQKVADISENLRLFLEEKAGEYDEFIPFTPLQDVKNRHKCVMLAFNASAHLKEI